MLDAPSTTPKERKRLVTAAMAVASRRANDMTPAGK
jgi:hypothetical protein